MQRVGGTGGGSGDNSAVRTAPDVAALSYTGFCLRCPRAMVEPSVYDEPQGMIKLLTPPKKRKVSSADSTASVACSAWDGEPAKAAVLSLQRGCRSWSAAAQQRSHEGRCLHVSHSKNEFSKRVATCNRVLGTQLLDRSWGILKSCVPKQTASKKLRCDSTGLEPHVLHYVWQRFGARPQALASP